MSINTCIYSMNMDTTVIGYTPCPHYQNACRLLPQATQSCVGEHWPIERAKIKAAVLAVIGTRAPVDLAKMHFRSPQIVCRTSTHAVCVDGEDALRRIDDLGTYVLRRIASKD